MKKVVFINLFYYPDEDMITCSIPWDDYKKAIAQTEPLCSTRHYLKTIKVQVNIPKS